MAGAARGLLHGCELSPNAGEAKASPARFAPRVSEGKAFPHQKRYSLQPGSETVAW